MAKREPSAGLYVHVPFCASICNYCNFNRGLLDEGLKRAYVDAAAREIARRGAEPGGVQGSPPEKIDTIYFGGGTPSLLSPDQLLETVAAIERGEFPPRPHKPRECTWCAYPAICRKEYAGDD